ncbi:nucleotidyltransferase family protein [Pantoea rodasii]|uniref:Nucleotidyltransferase family protein n=2 Tax=Pantoea rodasii TaxID=1076549 RepID=A0A2M9W9U4_9GAMM|nr:nucleotidyltransferase family protein [Pantoea rodasii]
MAAGLSRRFRETGHGNKLNAMLNGKAVLQHAFDNARASGMDVFVLTRPEDEQLHQLLPSPSLLKYTSEGLSDSIAASVRAVPDYDGWLIALGDMPFISPSSFQAVSKGLQVSAMARADVDGIIGHPVGFSRALYPQLIALRGDTGARGLLSSVSLTTVSLHDRGCLTDIDTYEDLLRFSSKDL